METKPCSRCQSVLPLTEFHRSKIHPPYFRRPECKACRRPQEAERRKRDGYKEYMKEAQRKFLATPHGKAKRREYSRAEGTRKYQREYAKRPEQRERVRIYRSEYRRRPEVQAREKSRNKVKWAIESGAIPPVSELSCRYCGNVARHYHHPSYLLENWLVIVPVCTKCHGLIHRRYTNDAALA
jgi:hypothetical protein